MDISLNSREFRLLLDMVYIGNWVLNSTRENDRFQEYDDLESKLFALCREHGLKALVEQVDGVDIPSAAYIDGGIHQAIVYYEDNVFYEILAEELSRRDMAYPDIDEQNYPDLVERMSGYMEEFQQSGLDHLVLDT